MKYLHDVRLSALTARLQECRVGHRFVSGRVEAYTMKRAGTDKKYAADLGHQFVVLQENLDNELAAAAARIRADQETFENVKNTVDRKRRSQSVGEPLLVTSTSGVSNNNTDATTNVKQTRERANSLDEDLLNAKKQKSKQVTKKKSNNKVTMAKKTVLPRNPSRGKAFLSDYLHDLGTRRLLTDLILTLNMSYPDYDFGNAYRDFERLPSAEKMMQHVQTQLGPLVVFTSSGDDLLQELWTALDSVIDLSSCEVFHWNADLLGEDDSFLHQAMAAGATNSGASSGLSSSAVYEFEEERSNASYCLWSFHYLLVNKTLKRIVFFSCSERTLRATAAEGEGATIPILDEEEDEQNRVNMIPLIPEEALEDSGNGNFDLDPYASTASGGLPITTA